MFVDPLGLVEPIAGFNGGVYVAPDLRVLESHPLSKDATNRTMEMMAAHGLDCWLYTGEDWYIHDAGAPHVARETRTVAFAPKIVENFDAFTSSAAKIVGISDDDSRMRKADQDIGRALDGEASVARSQPYYLDVTNPLANKGAVVRYHSVRLGISPAAIATIGDMPNDVLMFRASGFSVAMGNASPDVQAAATAVTDSCDDEGFAKAVERFLLDGDAP